MTTTHKLDFEAAPWEPPLLIGLLLKMNNFETVAFRVGTCEGIYRTSDKAYQIIAITNSEPGNGHFEDVLQWFEASCRRDKKALMFMEIMNDKFGKHLQQKRGFKKDGLNNMIKKFR